LRALGWLIVRITWLELNEDPGELEARLWAYFEGAMAA
jgi:hypothetical protein